MEESGRVYRKGNWSLHETMILIEAKKVDYGRRTQRTLKESGGGAGSSRPQEMRWKWVEDCCWKQGCHRSQNQCNDRWDNLMRDYKKVRSYEASSSHDPASPSYWKLERHERKERNLPANLLPEIYEALSEVAQIRAAMAEKPQGGGDGGTPLVAPSIDSEDSERSISASPESSNK
ncbi:trihelix transcription factor ASR3-like, partial [Curcuma longa]|uniref:trihelix transcription factor ASR3-like n=1 Tax=Curcuma longa TaxID=136217 RepID=UPI003D9E3480